MVSLNEINSKYENRFTLAKHQNDSHDCLVVAPTDYEKHMLTIHKCKCIINVYPNIITRGLGNLLLWPINVVPKIADKYFLCASFKPAKSMMGMFWSNICLDNNLKKMS